MTAGEVVLGVIFAITAGAAIYYARQARAQVKQGEREFLPLAKAAIRSFSISSFERVLAPVPEGYITTRVERNIAARILNGAIDIRCLLVNLSRGRSDFKLDVFPWLEYNNGNKIDLRHCISNGPYTGKDTWILYFQESVDGHFALSVVDVMPIDDFVKALETGDARLHVELLLKYPENPKAQILYDHYYTGGNINRHGYVIEGGWVFGGRSETPKKPQTVTA